MSLAETATFRADDDSRLVEASLACRVCLSSEIEWSLTVAEYEADVHCRCRACGDVRSVSLTSSQALRLSVDRRLV
jgi:uncharacterized Zn finger protein